MYLYLFFFSSRRRHTRWTGDWSSDVCSSDLGAGRDRSRLHAARLAVARLSVAGPDSCPWVRLSVARSEERRVGKEGRSRWGACHQKKKREARLHADTTTHRYESVRCHTSRHE